jgi:hypothetical protein
VVDRRVVCDSGGHREDRFVIHTPVRLHGREWSIEITLTNREDIAVPTRLLCNFRVTLKNEKTPALRRD